MEYTAKTGILGYFGCRNAGDDAFYDFWQQRFGNHSPLVSDKFKFKSVKDIILGGGALVNEYFISRLPSSFDRLHLVSCSLPYGDSDIKRLEPFSEKLGTVLLRSHRDLKAAQGLIPQAEYIPDIIFDHEFREQNIDLDEVLSYCSLPPINYSLDRKNLIVFVSDHYRSPLVSRFLEIEHYKERLASALDALADYYNIMFIPMSIWYDARDNVFAADVASRMRKLTQVAVIDKYLGPDLIYSIIKQHASLVLSMKYHGMIFSMRAAKPFLNIGDTRKNHDLLVDNGLTELDCNVQSLTLQRVLDTVKVAESADLMNKIGESTAQNREKIRSSMHLIQSIFNSHQ